jgi:hypothetical protein
MAAILDKIVIARLCEAIYYDHRWGLLRRRRTRFATASQRQANYDFKKGLVGDG